MNARCSGLRIAAVLLTAAASACTEPASPNAAGGLPNASAASHAQAFVDSFERDTGWGIFEEIVGGNACYGAGIGEVARTRKAASHGRTSLKVWANKTLSSKSNHVLANRKLADEGRSGPWRYQLRAYIDPATAATGQVGPEFSMQNTRNLPGLGFRTSTAGIQYIANPHILPRGQWQIWTETSPGVAGWVTFHVQPLAAGVWHQLTLDADYTRNRYGTLTIRGDDVAAEIDLASFVIVPETKFGEEAFWLTLESENLWSNCGAAGPFEYRVFYDDVKLLPR